MLVIDVLPFDTTQITSDKNWSHPRYGDPCHPLASNQHPPCVVINEEDDMSYQEITGCISQGAHPGSYNGQDAYNDMLVTEHGTKHRERTASSDEHGRTKQYAGHDARQTGDFDRGGGEMNSVVRRLTPLECERLQGMPDDWSKYGMNEDGSVYELSDSARYKLQGNGIATPFWRWLLKRISAQYERTPTLGSLFDGQASFPMIWEGINGPGTALWSSEIDKNAQAVSRYHFPEK